MPSRPLRRLYAFAGEWPGNNFFKSAFAYQNILIPFELLGVHQGKLVFLEENQGSWACGTDTEGLDSPVWVKGVADDRYRLAFLQSAGVESMERTIVAGSDVDRVTSNRDTLGALEARNRAGPHPGLQVDHFKRTVGDAGDKQRFRRRIISHVIDAARDACPIRRAAHVGKGEGPLNDRSEHISRLRRLAARARGLPRSGSSCPESEIYAIILRRSRQAVKVSRKETRHGPARRDRSPTPTSSESSPPPSNQAQVGHPPEHPRHG